MYYQGEARFLTKISSKWPLARVLVKPLIPLWNWSHAFIVCVSLNFVFQAPTKRHIIICFQHVRAILAPNTKFFYIPATKQWQKHKNHVVRFVISRKLAWDWIWRYWLTIVDKELSREDHNPDVEETAVNVKEISATEEKNPALDYNSKDARKAKLHVLCESKEPDLRMWLRGFLLLQATF